MERSTHSSPSTVAPSTVGSLQAKLSTLEALLADCIVEIQRSWPPHLPRELHPSSALIERVKSELQPAKDH